MIIIIYIYIYIYDHYLSNYRSITIYNDHIYIIIYIHKVCLKVLVRIVHQDGHGCLRMVASCFLPAHVLQIFEWSYI